MWLPTVLPSRQTDAEHHLANLQGVSHIQRAPGLEDQWAPRELRHSFVSILSAHGVRIEEISDLVGHGGT